jgi:hypothetical protein
MVSNRGARAILMLVTSKRSSADGVCAAAVQPEKTIVSIVNRPKAMRRVRWIMDTSL